MSKLLSFYLNKCFNCLIFKVLAKDANIVVAVTAAKCVGGIASGLRKEFNKYISIVSIFFSVQLILIKILSHFIGS